MEIEILDGEVDVLTADTIRYQLFLGGTRGYTESQFTVDDVINAIWQFLAARTLALTYNIVKCKFVRAGYKEDGFRIETVNYPTRPAEREVITRGILELGKFLMDYFQQERVNIASDQTTWLLQRKKTD